MSFLRRLTIRQRLFALSMVAIALLLAVGTAGLLGVRRLGDAIDRVTHATAGVRLQGDADMMHDAIRADVLAALVAGGDPAAANEARASLQRHTGRLRTAMQELATAGHDVGARADGTPLRAALDAYVRDAEAIAARAGRDPAGARALLPRFGVAFRTLEEEMGAVTARTEEAARQAQAQGQRSASQARWLALAITAASFLLLGWLSRRITLGIVEPLEELVRAHERVATGDLTAGVEVRGNDETGRIATSFNAMVGDLRATLRRIGTLSADLASSSVQISATAHETSGMMTGLDMAIEQIAGGSADQANAAQETAHLMGEMSESIRGVAETAREVAASAGETVETARRGGETVQGAIRSMDGIRGAVFQAGDRVRELGSRSERIGEIVAAITTIAEQTNLLALNAAIEAARAGDQGRGFAVVADEVRKLAESSAASAGEITALVADIREGTRRVADAMEAGTATVEGGMERARDAIGALGSILDSLEETHSRVEHISFASQELTSMVGRLSGLVEDVASIAEESAASAEEMSAQSSEVSRAVESIASSSQDGHTQGAASAQTLAVMAGELREAVEQFRV